MGEENNKSQNKEQPKRFNQQQYDLLKKCSEKKDITEWNQYRQNNPNEDIELEGEYADFTEWQLEGVFLNHGFVQFNGENVQLAGNVYLRSANFSLAHLEDAKFIGTHLEEASLHSAHLERAMFKRANLERATFDSAYMEGTDFECANLECAYFEDATLTNATFLRAHMKGVNFFRAFLENANFLIARLENADLSGSHLEGTNFSGAYLKNAKFLGAYLGKADFCLADIRGVNFSTSVVNSETNMFNCKVDKKTDFRNVAIDSMQIESGQRQLLKYNIRRMNWEDWYKEYKILRWPVWLFWQMSNYGSSTLRIIAWFFGLAFGFAFIYRVWPGLVMVRGGIDHLRDFIHALYFSVVTMTTLGFGDIAANPDSHCGQILLMVQVILGYVLLGALITRLAVLFTGEGPAGKFSNEKKEDANNSKDRTS